MSTDAPKTTPDYYPAYLAVQRDLARAVEENANLPGPENIAALLSPQCAGVWGRHFDVFPPKVCQRCGATRDMQCGDISAREAQTRTIEEMGLP